MLGDTAVAVHPDDSRYQNVIGKKVLLPVAERQIPVIGDEYVDVEFGTGALKITPAHDPNDFEIGERHKLEVLQVIGQDGKMNELAGKYAGLDRFEARKQIVNKLEESGLIEKIEDYVHNIGYSERGGAIVEPYLSDQWFVSMTSLAGPALEAVTSGKVKFYPERWAKVYGHWMTNIKDWCISRQLWWGHQIPVWYNKRDGSKYCEVNPPPDIENWEQDPDVLDTWFSSWLWPFSTMGWPDETQDLKIFYPTDFLSTAPDIIFFWVARMIMASMEFTGKVPFYNVYYHNIIRDEKGRKLSKSLGNSPDVIDVMNEYGTDALRFTLVYLAPQGVDVFFSKEKCELGRNFANKIWNASRFLLMNKHQAEKESKGASSTYKPDLFDKWIESRLNTAIRTYLGALSEYKINEASKALHEFIWGDFCDWYIELLKIKSSENPEYSKIIFERAINIFENVLKLLHPIMPFITEELWQSINDREEGESITISDFPVLNKKLIAEDIENEVSTMQQLVTAIRNLRAELNLKPSVKCDVLIKCEKDSERRMIDDISQYVKILAKTDKLETALPADLEKRKKFKSITSVVNNLQVYVKIEGLVDIEQEKKRLNKEIERTEAYLKSLDKKLENENFVKKASKDIVENEKRKQEDFRSKLEKLKEHYHSLTD
jgi:valyl-tRNA synthetase